MKITESMSIEWDNSFAQESGREKFFQGDTQHPSFGCLSKLSISNDKYSPMLQHSFQGTITAKQHQHCIYCGTKISMDNSGNLQYEPSEKLIAAQFKTELGE